MCVSIVPNHLIVMMVLKISEHSVPSLVAIILPYYERNPMVIGLKARHKKNAINITTEKAFGNNFSKCFIDQMETTQQNTISYGYSYSNWI